MTEDWKIVMVPRSKHVETDGEGLVDILSGDEADAIDRLEDLAHTIQSLGYMPDTGFWVNNVVVHITGRQSKKSFRIRSDQFERETDNGWSEGHGFLRVEKA